MANTDTPVKPFDDRILGMESVFDTAPVGLCVLDLSFRYVIVNECFARMYGLKKADFIGRTVEEALPGPASQILLNLREALAADSAVEREIALQNPAVKGGSDSLDEVIYLRTARPLRNQQGLVWGFSVALVDITARMKAERSFRAVADDLRYTIELSPHLPWTTDASGELTFMSPRWNTITGTTGNVHLKEWADVLHPEDLTITADIWATSVASGNPYDAEYRIRYADGGWRWVRARAYPRRSKSGEIIRWYGTVEDIHDRKVIAMQLEEATEELARKAQEDHLTGLPNRRRFDQALKHEIDRARRANVTTALIMLDIDHFKNYNDIGGHLLGDECLRAVAAIISRVIRRPADLAARFGGEEFVVLLPDTKLEGANVIANRILEGIRDLSFDDADPRLRKITASAGVAILESTNVSVSAGAATALIQAADKALYTAKRAGRNRVVS